MDDVEGEISRLHDGLRTREQVFWWQVGRHPAMWGEFGIFVMSLHPKFKTKLSLNRFEIEGAERIVIWRETLSSRGE